MAALVQTFPAQQSSTPVALMQPRSQSSSGTNSQTQSGHHSQHQNPRYTNSANSNGGYRGGYNTAPVAPYAFTSTPGLSNTKPAVTAPRLGERTSSVPTGRPDELRKSYSDVLQSSPSSRPVDDSNLRSRPQQNNLRPLSTVGLPAPQPIASPTTRPSPDRYRRVNRRSEVNLAAANVATNTQPSGSGMAAVAAVYNVPNRASSSPSLPPVTGSGAGAANTGAVKAPFIGDYTGQLRGQSVDDMSAYIHPSQQSTTQNRRRSVGPGSITTENFQTFLRQELANKEKPQLSPKASSPGLDGTGLQLPVRPRSRRTGSTDSSGSGASSKSSVRAYPF
jgi:hypothetical protein